MTFKQWVIEAFKDERGSTSIKPVIAFMGAIFLCVTMVINSIKGIDFKPSSELVNAVMIITAIGMGADTLDKFSSRKTEIVETYNERHEGGGPPDYVEPMSDEEFPVDEVEQPRNKRKTRRTTME